LARLLARLPRPSPTVLVGPGDDAAVVAPARNERLVLTTDAVVEGVHFTCAISTPDDIGHKALAVNLSDLAAMAATPQWALLSLMVPASHQVEDLEKLVDGLARLAEHHGVSVVGGNITRTDGPLVVDVTAAGSVAPRKWLLRSGGRPGDELYVSGVIGAGRAGLEMSQGVGPGTPDEACVQQYRRPEPRVRLGVAVGRARAARAAMDLSDGLADALQQVATASHTGVRIDADALPIAPGAQRWWQARGEDAVNAALSGGDDYELLFAVAKRQAGALRTVRSRVANPPMTRIGVLTKDPAERVLLRNGREEALPSGYEHFSHAG
jgi:thiamine-monophosphate kinase